MKSAALLLVALVLAGCAQPAPTSRPSPPITPAPTPSAVASTATLRVQGTVRASCGSFGGCAYFAELTSGNERHKAEFAWRSGGRIVVDTGLPEALPWGEYTVTLTSNYVSDVIANGVRQIEQEDARCVATFTVAGFQIAVSVNAVFDKGSCEVVVEIS